MKQSFKVLLLSLSIVASTSLSSVATVSADGSFDQNISQVQNENNILNLDGVKPIYDPNFKEKAKEQGLDPDTIIAGYYIPFPTSSPDQTTGNVIDRVSGRGPAPLSMSFNNSVTTGFSTELSSEFGLDGTKIAAKLGTSYIASHSYTKTYGPIQVPSGKTYTIYCAPTYNYYSFELWEDDVWYDDYIGTYTYEEPTGIYFYHQDTTNY